MPPAFLDREVELRRLEETWGRAVAGQPQLIVVWGRRRVGKTYLLSHFTADKRTVFHGSTEQAEAIELGRLGESVARGPGSQVLDAVDQPLAVVLDEVPYLTRTTAGFTSIVQAVWDHLAAPNHLFLVLNGWATAVMERMLGAGGSLRGRPTGTIRIDPLDPWAARRFLPSPEPDQFVQAYAACGGYPLHLRAWNQDRSVDANLERLAASPGGLLLEDESGVLREELPESGGYARILAAIGRGRHRYGAIASEAGQRIEHALEVLVAAGFVRRAVPVGAPAGAKPVYDIADPYLTFWFQNLYADVTHIDAGQGRQVLQRVRPGGRATSGPSSRRWRGFTPGARRPGATSPATWSSAGGGRPAAKQSRSTFWGSAAAELSSQERPAGRRGRSAPATCTSSGSGLSGLPGRPRI